MNQYTYYILDGQGYILLTIISQKTNRSVDDEAEFSVRPLLPVVAKQYGLDNVFWSDTGR